DAQALRSQDVGLLTVRVGDERDEGGAVRVVLEPLDGRRLVPLATLEVDHPVELLGAAAAEADGDPAVAAATARLGQAFDERLFRLALMELGLVDQDQGAAARRGRIELLESHLFVLALRARWSRRSIGPLAGSRSLS